MSASLVGSEMCIRDRHQLLLRLGLDFQGSARAAVLREGCEAVAAAPSAAKPGSARRARRQTPAALRAASAGGLGGCLLYTSDAADDM
eukprot:5393564-Alexandrium_andersonii.AAC.1